MTHAGAEPDVQSKKKSLARLACMVLLSFLEEMPHKKITNLELSVFTVIQNFSLDALTSLALGHYNKTSV